MACAIRDETIWLPGRELRVIGGIEHQQVEPLARVGDEDARPDAARTHRQHPPGPDRVGRVIRAGTADELLGSQAAGRVPVDEPVAVDHLAERVHAAGRDDAGARMALARPVDGVVEELEELAERARLWIDDRQGRRLRRQRIVRKELLGVDDRLADAERAGDGEEARTATARTRSEIRMASRQSRTRR